MKTIALVVLLALSTTPATASDAAVKTQDKTITKVVKLLQDMLGKSKTEDEEEKKIYDKYKCYCDTTEKEKTASVDESTKQITILSAKIEELQGSTGELSSTVEQLKAQLAENNATQTEATAIRKKNQAAFEAEEADLHQGIQQMNDALQTLTEVGADQTAASSLLQSAIHKEFMSGKLPASKKKEALLSLQSKMKSAFASAEAFMNEKQYSTFATLVQAAPGDYSSQSGQVLGIIKQMRDTFETNLDTAIQNEKSQKASYEEIMHVKKAAQAEMQGLYDESQDTIAENDAELGSKREQLAEAQASKDEDEEFLGKLVTMCKAKAKDFSERKLMRTNEEAAISQAISILNSDAAFETFSTVSATSTGETGAPAAEEPVVEEAPASFLQISRHTPVDDVHADTPTDDVRAVMQRLIQRAADEQGNQAPRLNHVIALVKTNNPFATVIDEIEKMIGVIDAESKADQDKLDWCNEERDANLAAKADKNEQIMRLGGVSDDLTKTIDDPVTGLKQQISETEISLVQNNDAQKSETAERKEANVAYQKDVKNLVAAEGLLHNAIKVLKAFYDKIDEVFIQSMENDKAKQDPEPPEDLGSYKGQSSKGGDAVSMLEYILSETETEERASHATEEAAQHAYEDSMADLKAQQAEKEKSLAELQASLANKEQDLLDTEEELKATEGSRDSVEAYLEKIKPGCDFITENFELRTKNRQSEKTALENAMATVKDSPAFTDAENAATVESYGKCKDPCVEDATHVNCKACMADVSVAGYCAGHKGTPGC